MIQPPTPALRLSLDEGALAHNWHVIAQLSGAAQAGAAIKADGYGIGARRAARVLRKTGCRDFFIAHWSEAQPLLDVIDPASISVLHGPMIDTDCDYARATGIKPVLNSLAQIDRWLAGGGGRCDVMVDSGINRIGLSMAEISDPRLGQLDVDLCMSHLASADEDSPQNALQLARFGAIRQAIKAQRYSLANSAGVCLGGDYLADLTRPGLALYGGSPRVELAGSIRQVVGPEAQLIQTRQLQAGDSVGYNATITATRAMRVGVVSMGYADGWLRCWSSGVGSFHADGSDIPVLGRVSMDMTVVDLTHCNHLGAGDWLAANYDLRSASAASGLSQYELLTLLGARFLRGD